MEKINWKLIVFHSIVGILVSIIFTIFSYYFFEIAVNFDFVFKLIYYCIVLLLMVYTPILIRGENNNNISFSHALISAFIVGSLTVSSLTCFQLILPNIDKEYAGKLYLVSKEKVEEQGERLGYSDEQIKQATNMAKNIQSNKLVWVAAILIVLFLSFIVSLIIAAFVKRNSTDIIEARTRNES